jgi:hypothetical protein
MATDYIAMTMNVATPSYCHALQRTTTVAINLNSCNAKLATVAITLLQRDFLQPLPTDAIWLHIPPFATKLALLQRFVATAQGLEVSSHGPKLYMLAQAGKLMLSEDDPDLRSAKRMENTKGYKNLSCADKGCIACKSEPLQFHHQ